eukprot:1146579-Prymnesium_polylepis.2
MAWRKSTTAAQGVLRACCACGAVLVQAMLAGTPHSKRTRPCTRLSRSCLLYTSPSPRDAHES